MAKKKTARTNFEVWLQNPRRPYFESGMVGNSRSLGMGAVYALVFVALFYGVFSLALKSTGIKIKADPLPVEAVAVYMPKDMPKASGVVLHLNSGIPSLPGWVVLVQDTPLMSGRSVLIAALVLGFCLCVVGILAVTHGAGGVPSPRGGTRRREWRKLPM